MMILNAVVSTINISLALLLLMVLKDEKTRAGRFSLKAFAFLLVLNTAMIWY